MAALVRAATLRALRNAAQFSIPEETRQANLAATPELVRDPERLAPLEAAIKATLTDGALLPAALRSSAVPVLGNIAEAVVESLLGDRGWQPVYGDDQGFSFGPGIDLLMMDPTLARLVAIEVKSTIQPGRWPRLARGRSLQLTPEWLNGPGNTGMVEWGVRSDDTFLMVVQVQLRSRRWRCCLAGDPISPRPVTEERQLEDLDWLVPLPN
ncbi:hypothetical protein [Knoellia aerolata]|uniref:Uncharacterized protein n=1 Tax=Knoellia aerolata DSM 18566 TaxID=1385519 RepID=A0A0A0JQP5_9MICO|nr:hypothetical protein [Knoellia aerolata]KGN39805.1 hypothetical protein N801_18915 [Knoellia aerolata DSM 18566]